MKTDIQNTCCIICTSKMRCMFRYQNFYYYRCRSCDHVTTLPYPNDNEIQLHYSNGFKKGNYRVAIDHSDVYDSVMERMARKVTTIIEKNKKKRIKDCSVLDIGCYTGEFLCHMENYGAQVFGIELQNEAVELAQQKLPGKIVQGDITKRSTCLPQKQFDVVCLLGIIEHVVDPRLLLRKSVQMIKPGGSIIIQTPNATSTFAILLKKYWPPFAPIEHIHLFSVKSLKYLLTQFNLGKFSYRRHCKKMSVSYVYSMFKTFGPEYYRLLNPLYRILSPELKQINLPLYAGEIFAFAES